MLTELRIEFATKRDAFEGNFILNQAFTLGFLTLHCIRNHVANSRGPARTYFGLIGTCRFDRDKSGADQFGLAALRKTKFPTPQEICLGGWARYHDLLSSS